MNHFSLRFILKICTSKGVFKKFGLRYSKVHIAQLNKWMHFREKMHHLQLTNKFLNTCIVNKIVPNFLEFRIRKSKVKQSPSMERAFINDQIEKNVKQIESIKQLYRNLRVTIKQWISELDYLRFLKYLSMLESKHGIKIQAKHGRNIQFLKRKRFGSTFASNSNIVHNVSSYQLSTTEMFVLNHGLKFCIPPKRVNREELFAEFEHLVGQLNHHSPRSTERLQQLKAKLIDISYSYCGTPIDVKDFRMHKECLEAARELRQNNNIVISRPDKGSGVVILNRDQYNTKMLDILADTTKFTQIGPSSKFDFTFKIEEAFQNRFSALLHGKIISQEIHDEIRPSGSQRPKMYGIPKTHKQGKPLRPVLAMIGSPHRLAKWLITILEPIRLKFSKFTVKYSFSFAEFIR